MEVLQPPEWARPKGYANGIATRGTQVFVGGQIGWNPMTSTFETDEFAGQFSQALKNVVAVVTAAGGKPEHICRLTWYITDKKKYLAALPEVGAAYREIMGRHYPVMAVLGITELVEDRGLIEIEADAVIPD